MPTFDYKCTECDFEKEYNTSHAKMKPPEKCPVCGKGTLEKQFSAGGQSFDVIGGYDYEYGKKNLNKRSAAERSAIASGQKDPY